MITAGDEMGRTQQGNNNAYCQDNALSWLDWNLEEDDAQLLAFTRGLIELRHAHPSLRRPKFFQDRQIRGQEIRDLLWYAPDGSEMSDEQWQNDWVRSLGMQLTGGNLDVLDEQGRPLLDDTLLLLLNAHDGPVTFTVPAAPIMPTPSGAVRDLVESPAWELVLDTAAPNLDKAEARYAPGESRELDSRSLVLLCWRVQPEK